MSDALRVSVRGMVQGVGFRYHTLRRAKSLGLCGWVRNERDGSVLVHLQGDAEVVEEMVRWLNHGPSYARVDSVDTDPAAYDPSLFDFQVVY